jgi:dCMP deaminase
MLIGVSGTLSSGKTEVVRYLTFQGFKLLQYEPTDCDGVDEINDKLASGKITAQNGKVVPSSVSNGTITSTSSVNGSLTKPRVISGIDVYKTFNQLDEFIDFVTVNWQQNYVISHINDMNMLHGLQKRPFFLHISIDAPISLRYQRHCQKSPDSFPTLDGFISANDTILFGATQLIEINNQAQVKIINTTSSIENLYIKLSELNLSDLSRLRPTWDLYFMRLADLAALRSNCMKRRVGCVIVKQARVIATGYNGTPRHLTNCNQGGCPRCNSSQGSGTGLATCLCLHAEENALLEAGRDRIGNESILYCNTCPCLTCSIKIVQSGIKEVVYAQSYSMDDASHKVMSNAGIILRQFQPPIDGIFI